MKLMSIKIRILKTDIYESIQYNVPVSATNSKDLLPVFDPNAYTNISTFKEKLTEYKIENVTSCDILENADNLTQTAVFKIPRKNTILKRDVLSNGAVINGYLRFKNNETLLTGSMVIVDMGYNDNLQTRFIGYIREFIEEQDLIAIHLDDVMYKLKNSLTFKKNFPRIYKGLTTTYYKPDKTELKPIDITTDGVKLNLYHIAEWIVDELYRNNTINNKTFVPRIRCISSELGKIVMNEYFTPAEILQFIVKDMYNLKVYFRLEYVNKDDGNPIPNTNLNIMEPVLYLGWGNWDSLEYYDIKLNTVIDTEAKRNRAEVVKPLSFDNANPYSYQYNFMYPYKDEFRTNYNPIVEYNLDWYNTEKDNIKVTLISFDAVTNNTYTTTYQYNEFKHTTNELKQDKDDESLKQDKDKINEDKKGLSTDELNDKGNLIKKSNNLQSFTEVMLYYPNLVDEIDRKNKITEYLNTIPTSGLNGSITVLGEPYIRQGDIVNLKIDVSRINNIEQYIEDQHISYYVKEVQTTFNDSTGIKQILTLGNKVGTKITN